MIEVKHEWKDRFILSVEDYLHGLITMINELVRFMFAVVGLSCLSHATCPLLCSPGQSRLAVNAVTLGDYEAPIRISLFVKELFAGFSMVRFP